MNSQFAQGKKHYQYIIFTYRYFSSVLRHTILFQEFTFTNALNLYFKLRFQTTYIYIKRTFDLV